MITEIQIAIYWGFDNDTGEKLPTSKSIDQYWVVEETNCITEGQ